MIIPGYSIKQIIGKGGMATAYLAVQESLGREVVLKVLDTSQLANQEDMIERFLAEGRIVASLNHPNIITIFDIGIAEDEFYISMEYVKGGDLKQRIKAGVDPDKALDYLAQIARGLGVAHQHGVVHRDIKPANILFRDDETPLITDFGIAKQIDLDRDLTSTGIFLGSPNYVSPEQADGHSVDGRADIYSLGCILYELLTGNKPFEFTSVIDVVIQHKQAPIPKLPEEVEEFQPLLNTMMAKRPDDRFENTASLLTAIEKLRETRASRRQPAAARTYTPEKGPKRKILLLILIPVLILSAGFFATVLYIDARLKSVTDMATIASMQTSADSIPAELPKQSFADATSADLGPNREEVARALVWLGQQSLEEYRLTHPPQDNAYYYFSKLAELEPDSAVARSGIRDIAERYAVLAERALAQNDRVKTEAYVVIGLKVDPGNTTLLKIRDLLAGDTSPGLLDGIRKLIN